MIVYLKSHYLENLRLGKKVFFLYNYKVISFRSGTNYKQQDFVDEIKRLTQDKGVDIILDMIGGDYFPRNLKCMAFDARLVQIAIQKGSKIEADLLPIMLKRLMITGSTLRSRSNSFKKQIAKQLLEKVWPLLESGKIKPVIHSTFALEQSNLAHELLESSQHIGKIILTKGAGNK